MNNEIGKTLILIGTVIVVLGLVFTFFPKGTGLPKLPGDIYIKGKSFTFYFPLATSILLSAVLSLILYLFFKK
jgi:hypothetical protein